MENHVLTKKIQKCPNHTYKLLTGHLKLKQIAMRGSKGLNGGAEDLLLFGQTFGINGDRFPKRKM